jgi:fermentation-respiration switch protein FrsA (DUF1100 family)
MRTFLILYLLAAGCAPLEPFVYQPRPLPAEILDRGGTPESAWITSADGTLLHGFYAHQDSPIAVVLYCHGNAGNVADREQILKLFHVSFKASVLVFDYRGYGKSEGRPDEAGILADARAARKWLAERNGVAETDVVLVGRSLGGAVAVDLALDGARGLVLESTFTALTDVADHHLWPLPGGALLRTKLHSAGKVGAYRGPLLQSHGTADATVPFSLGQKLFAAANEPKRFIAIPGGEHNDPPTRAYLSALWEFLRDLPR